MIINGKHWHIEGDNLIPINAAACLLQMQANELRSSKAESKDATINDAANFTFCKIDTHHLYPYSKSFPNMSHNWKLLQAFIAPKTSRSFMINYKVGHVKKFSETISANVAYQFLKSSVGYNGSISLAETSILTEEKSVSLTIILILCLNTAWITAQQLNNVIDCDNEILMEKNDIKLLT